MKKFIRILSGLLTVIMLVGALTGLSMIEVSATSTTNKTDNKETWRNG